MLNVQHNPRFDICFLFVLNVESKVSLVCLCVLWYNYQMMKQIVFVKHIKFPMWLLFGKMNFFVSKYIRTGPPLLCRAV